MKQKVWHGLFWTKNLRSKTSNLSTSQKRTKPKLRGSWLSQIEIDTFRDEVNHSVHPANQEEELAVQNSQNEEKPQINQLQDVDDTPTKSWRWRDLQREAEQGLEEINARRIIEIVDENLVKARVTPFDKRKKIRRTRKSDYWKLQKSYGKVNNITDVTQYQCNDITEIKHLTYAFTLTSNAKLHKSCYLNDKMKSMKRDQNWILQLEHNIKQLRKNISQVEQINTINASQKIWRNTGNIRKKLDIQNKNTRKNTSEKLKQKLLANNNRLKQYKKGKTDTIKMETL